VEEEPVDRQRSEPSDMAFSALSSTGRLGGTLQTSNPGDQLGFFDVATPTAPPPAAPEALVSEETAYQRRERLREDRAALVRELSHRTRQPFRALHAEANRASGASSVGAATVKQLEKGNAWLRKRL